MQSKAAYNMPVPTTLPTFTAASLALATLFTVAGLPFALRRAKTYLKPTGQEGGKTRFPTTLWPEVNIKQCKQLPA